MIVRYNKLEQNLFDAIEPIVKPKFTYGNMLTPMQVLRAVERKQNKNLMFTDVPSTYPTPTEKHKKNEGAIYIPKYNIFWRLECKSQVKYSDMVGRVLFELNFVKKIHEGKYCLILEGAYLIPSVRDIILNAVKEKRLERFVWLGDLEQFIMYLKQCTN
jgi:hypothetical protein